MTVSIVFVRSEDGDWEGVYNNGTLVAQGHKLSRHDWLDALEHGYTEYVEFEAGSWLEDAGYLPDTLAEFHAMGE